MTMGKWRTKDSLILPSWKLWQSWMGHFFFMLQTFVASLLPIYIYMAFIEGIISLLMHTLDPCFVIMMVPSFRFRLLLWAWFLFYVGTFKLTSCVGGVKVVGCVEVERQALVKFKQSLKDSNSNLLSSWVGEDCCRWRGICCNNETGHIVKLSLRNDPYDFEKRLIGEINPSLVELKYLNHLDLSGNYFDSSGFPKFVGSLVELRYLNLSNAGFTGRVPHELGNLSSLRYLDLNSNYEQLHVDSLDWVSHLSSLQHLDMSWVNFSMASDWLQSINMLPAIQNLHMSDCSLGRIPASLPHVNFTSLYTLHLSGNGLGQPIPAWLLNISSIVQLDLGDNNLRDPSLITALGSLCNLETLYLAWNSLSRFEESFSGCIKSSLRDLDLSSNRFSGYLPHWLGQLSNLKSLSFHRNSLSGQIPEFLGTLSTLRDLDLSDNSLSGPIPASLDRLSSLRELDLSYNSLFSLIPETLGRLSTLRKLDLSNNFFWGQIPASLGRLSSLRELCLDNNSLSGPIPASLSRLSSLRELYLGYNSLSGPIPASLGRLSSLRELHLYSNRLNGTIPESVGQLSNLFSLRIYNNSFEGVLSESHFSNLTKLEMLIMFSNSLVMNVSSNWVPPFQAIYIQMDDCKLGPQFPAWLRKQKKLSFLSMSNANISDTIPDWFWNTSSHLEYINLSNNSISGSISTSIEEMTTNPHFLSLSSNRLNGSIPLSICKMDLIMTLSLSNNHLTGEIPQCLGHLQRLMDVDLENNCLSGDIPSSIGQLSMLTSLHLSKNNLSGELPASLKNRTQLTTLDLGENGFFGKLPTWIGERLSSLEFLILRSNKFEGSLPPQLSLLSKLQVLDLSQNNLSGTIPASFGNFSAMAMSNKTNEAIVIDMFSRAMESIWVSWKGNLYQYSSTLSLVININLSGNDLSGEIPEEITRLSGLQSLNLSKNHLTGTIPERIGDLRWMESLDLSRNNLSGIIPQTLSNLTSLSHLNLSYNNFYGRIPSGSQLTTLDDPSIYMGNPNLCGIPLPNQCPRDGTYHDTQSAVGDGDEAEDGFEIQPFYISMGVGFVVGFWLVCVILLFKRSWRIAYYRFFDDMRDRIYVAVATKVAKFQMNE